MDSNPPLQTFWLEHIVCLPNEPGCFYIPGCYFLLALNSEQPARGLLFRASPQLVFGKKEMPRII